MSKDNFAGTAGGRRELYQKNKYYGRKRFLFWWVKKKMPEEPGPRDMFAHIQDDMKDEYDFSEATRGMIQPDKPWPRSEPKRNIIQQPDKPWPRPGQGPGPMEVGVKLHAESPPAEEIHEEPKE